MKTLFLEKPGELRLRDSPALENPTRGQALVRVHRVGVCGTDLHAFEGTQPFFSYPRIIGHELGVEIVSVESNERGLQAGDRCSVEPYLNCGECVACRRGKGNCCVNMKVIGVHVDGGMREFVHVPIAKLHCSRSLGFESLALVEALGIGAHAVHRAGLEAGETALVLGLGPIGLTVVQFAQAAGAKIVVADISEKRLEFCRRMMGIEHGLNVKNGDLTQLRDICGDLPTAIFDCTGNPQSMNPAFSYAANGGRLIFVGFYSGDLTFNDQEFHRRELTVMGSRNALGGDFQRIIQLMEEGKIDAKPWITHRIPCDHIAETFPRLLDPEAGVLKAIVEW